MTDQTPAYWLVIYTADDWDGPLISPAEWAKTPEEASHRVVNARQGRNALNTAGPFSDQVEAESYRRTWAREHDRTARQTAIASLLTETASVIHTNELRDRPGRTPAQNDALPPAVSLYGAMNIVICGDPDDTRGTRDGVTAADLVRTFNAFLDQGSALEWSQAPERTHAEIMNALHACASAMRDAAGRAKSSTSPAFVGGLFVGPRVLVHVGDVLRHKGMVSDLIVTSRHEDRGFMLAPENGEPFMWDDFEMPGNEGSPFTLVSCPHLDDSAEPAAGAEDDSADDEAFRERGRAEIAEIMIREARTAREAEAGSDLGTSAYPHTEWIVTVHSDDEEGDLGARAGSILSTPSLETFMDQLRDAGLTTSIDRGADGVTYASAIAPTGYIRLRRPNPGEVAPVRITPIRSGADVESEGWSQGEDFDVSFTVEPAKEKPEPGRYRLGVLPMSTGTVYGVRDVALNVVLSDAFGAGYGAWSGTREAAESAVSALNAEWLTAGGWDQDLYFDPDSTITVDAGNGSERWNGRRWNRYVTDANRHGNMINVRILSID